MIEVEKWRRFRAGRNRGAPRYDFLAQVRKEAAAARSINYTAGSDFQSIMLDADIVRAEGGGLSNAAIMAKLEAAAQSVLRANNVARVAARKSAIRAIGGGHD